MNVDNASVDLLSSRAEWNEIMHNYPHSSLMVVWEL